MIGKLWTSSVNLTMAVKYFLLLGALTALAVVAGLNISGNENLAMSQVGYTLLMVLTVVVVVLSLHTSLKCAACFLVSWWSDVWRRSVNFRLLLVTCYGWIDFDDFSELGVWTLLPFVVFLVPIFLAAFAPYGYSSYTVFGPLSNVTGDSAGLGGQEGSFAKLLTSIELMPNETRRMYSSDHFLQPRFFCASTVANAEDAEDFNSVVHIPSWPYPNPDYMGDAGQRVTIRGVEAFTFNSSCTTGVPGFNTMGLTMHGLDSGGAPPSLASVGQTNTLRFSLNFALSFFQEYEGPYYGNLTCLSHVRRAHVSATWVINSTGYYLEDCLDIVPYNFTKSWVDISEVDTWLNLTTRNTLKNIAYPAWGEAASASDAAQYKVAFSLIHLVTWLYASSRTNDPTYDSTAASPNAGQVQYSIQPIYTYYSTNAATFGILVAVEALLLLSLALRFVPHGFHGGSIVQLMQLCQDINVPGWTHDLFTRNLGRATTRVEVLLDEDTGKFQQVMLPMPMKPEAEASLHSHETLEDSSGSALQAHIVGERDFSYISPTESM